MASASGTSSGSSQIANSGSEEDLQALLYQRKQKRMLSNRESARRSRMRKQKHLDDLMVQVSQLRKQNNQIVTALNITSQHYCVVEAENSVLRTQMVELGNRLQSLNDIQYYINGSNINGNSDIDSNSGFLACELGFESSDISYLMRPRNLMGVNQPIMASADMFQYS